MVSHMAIVVPIRIDTLFTAFLNTTLFETAYLHLGSGDVLFHNPRRHSEAQNEEIETTVFSDEDWLEIPYLDSDEEHAEMTRFAQLIGDETTKARLMTALAADKPFRQFRTVLATSPNTEKRWRLKRLEIVMKRVVEFCEAVDIEPDDPSWPTIVESVRQNQTQATARQWLAKLPPQSETPKRRRRPKKPKRPSLVS